MTTHQDKRAASQSFRVTAPERVYLLRFDGEKGSPSAEIEFQANNAYQALVIAHREGGGRSAQLWRDGKKLCTINELAGSFWEIRPCNGTNRERCVPSYEACSPTSPASCSTRYR